MQGSQHNPQMSDHNNQHDSLPKIEPNIQQAPQNSIHNSQIISQTPATSVHSNQLICQTPATSLQTNQLTSHAPATSLHNSPIICQTAPTSMQSNQLIAQSPVTSIHNSQLICQTTSNVVQSNHLVSQSPLTSVQSGQLIRQATPTSVQSNQHISHSSLATVPRPVPVPISGAMDNNPRQPVVHYIIRHNNMSGGPRSIFPGTPGQHIRLPNGNLVQTLLPQQVTLQRHPGMAMNPRAIIGQQAIIRGLPNQQTLIHPAVPTNQGMVPMSQASMPSQFVIHQPSVTATTPSQMSPEESIQKGTNVLNSILSRTPEGKRHITQMLIKELIEAKKTPEEFAIALQKEADMRNIPPGLIHFLSVFLPNLRQAVRSGRAAIPGVEIPRQPDETPPMTYAVPASNNIALAFPQSPMVVQSNNSQSSLTPINNSLTSNTATPSTKKKKVPLPAGQKSAWALKKEAREAKKKAKEESIKVKLGAEIKEIKTEKPTKSKLEKVKRQDKPKKPSKHLDSLPTTLKDDDDVNDVAAMGGVNLAEENQRIMEAGAEKVGTQIRSCKEELFLDVKSLTSRVAKIAARFNMPEPTQQVVAVISHAVQERLKNMVERLGVLAQHRCENLKFDPRYEVSHDVKSQIKFLAEVDRIEKQKTEEQEREMFLRAAKSRSKVEDPEQIKLRQKAKDWQRAKQEEDRQREANETALLAIGPRKKMKTNDDPSFPFSDQSRNLLDSKGERVRKVKRVSLKDFQLMLELDRSDMNQLIKITCMSK